MERKSGAAPDKYKPGPHSGNIGGVGKVGDVDVHMATYTMYVKYIQHVLGIGI